VRSLRELGCQHVIEAADGNEALTALQQQGAVDIALCDICMEGMDGLSFLREAGQRQLAHAVIISSDLAPDLLQTIGQMVKLLGMQLLGELAKNARPPNLKRLLEHYVLPSLSGGAAPASVSDAEVIHALEAGQFLVYYQPKFTLQDLQVDSLELLARWNHPRLGLLSPSRFLPTLERLGLLDRLLHQQIDQCLHFRQQAKTYGFDFKFSINIQTFQLASEGLFDAVSTRLRAFDTPGTCLCFEMTETDAQTLTPMNLENLVRLRMLGCVLSIDDFGAGHSSLQRLCTLPFNEIKLDGLFVRELNATSRSGVAITSTLQIADALGIDVVIEGIETQEQRTQLINLGCRLGQGYYFAMPMPATKLLVWLFNKVFQDYLSTVRRRLLSLPPP